MSTTSSVFEQLEETFKNQGVESTLVKLADELANAKKFHELFEARKLLLRHQLGLPLLYTGTGDDLDEEKQNELEEGLAAICREVGKQLMEAGKLREGWMYLRPVGDIDTAKSFITQAEVDDENIDELVELALREGIAPAFGFSLVLDHYGTCNSITTFDAEMSQHPLEERQAAAGQLVEHLHAELLENVKSRYPDRRRLGSGRKPVRQVVAPNANGFSTATDIISTPPIWPRSHDLHDC